MFETGSTDHISDPESQAEGHAYHAQIHQGHSLIVKSGYGIEDSQPPAAESLAMQICKNSILTMDALHL